MTGRKLAHWLVRGRRRIPLEPGETILGRDPGATVFIDDRSVSRRHARIVVYDEDATLEDLGSKNGTFVARGRSRASSRCPTETSSMIGSVALTIRIFTVENRPKRKESADARRTVWPLISWLPGRTLPTPGVSRRCHPPPGAERLSRRGEGLLLVPHLLEEESRRRRGPLRGGADSLAQQPLDAGASRLPRPTSTSVPASRRTIFHRKCEAVDPEVDLLAEVFESPTSRRRRPWTPGPRGSRRTTRSRGGPRRASPARAIAGASRRSLIHQTRRLSNAVRRREMR